MAPHVPTAKPIEAPVDTPPEPPARSQSPDIYHAGYSMGHVSAQIETLRSKLEDNRELLKSHFASVRETMRSTSDSAAHMQLEQKQVLQQQMTDSFNQLKQQIGHVESIAVDSREQQRQSSRQGMETLQKHFDDRLENMKDSIKLGVAVVTALLVWLLVQLTHTQQMLHAALQANNSRGPVSHEAPPRRSYLSYITG
jgi:uncharacterized membrane protein YccC